MFYYPFDGLDSVTVPYLGSKEEYDEFLSSELSPLLNDGGRVWTMIVCENANPHRFVQGRPEDLSKKVQSDELRAWLMANYELLSEQTYVGVYLASYGTSSSQALTHNNHGSFVPLSDGRRYPYPGT
jgi:hypothetical protein